MAHPRRAFISGTALLLALAVSIGGTRLLARQADARPDLTGSWVLNRELSAPTARTGSPDGDQGDQGRRGPRGGGMGRPGGMGGMGGGGMGGRGGFGGGEMPDREEMEQRRATMDAAMRVSTRLVVVRAEAGYLLTDDEGVSMRIPVEGTKDTGAVNGTPFETTTKWQDGKLRVERKFKGGLKVTDVYSVAGDPRVLTVASTVEGGRMHGSAPVNRVYNLEPR